MITKAYPNNAIVANGASRLDASATDTQSRLNYMSSRSVGPKQEEDSRTNTPLNLAFDSDFVALNYVGREIFESGNFYRLVV